MRVMHSLGTWSSRSTQPHRAKFNEDCQLGWKRKAKRHASARQRSALVIRAFVPQHGGKRLDTFPRELEYSALLGLQGRETNLQETQIMAAYEHLASSSLEQGYSKQVVDGRIVLLHAAVDGCRNLRNISLRSDRQSIALQEAKQGMVQWWLLPAALSLLQETEQPETVLAFGREALSQREGQAHKRDILLSMALAHCTLASSAFDGKDQVRLGCAHLEEALALLEEARLSNGSSKLTSEIHEGLRQLKPDCVIEHLKFSEGEGQKGARAQAIKVLKTLLANPELAVKEDGSTSVGMEFVKQSLVCLTSLETVNLLDWQDIAKHGPAISWYFDGLLRRGAVAHIVAGFVHRRPDLIEQGAALLLTEANADMLLERVVCCMLLADTQAASQMLLEAENMNYFSQRKLVGSTPKDAEESKVDEPVDTDALPPRAETLNFIRLHSPHGDYDLLPGIIFFTERWLTKVAFQRFKDTVDGQASPDVNSYYEEEKVTSYLSVRTRDNDSIRASISVMTDSLRHSFLRILDAPVSTKGSRNRQVDLPRLPLSGSPHAPAEQPAGKQWLRQLASKAPLPGRQVITGALLLGAVCVAASVTRRAEPTLTSDGNSTAVVQSVEQAEQTQSRPGQLWQWRAPWQTSSRAPRLRPRAAEACIRRWQVAKALALGPRHDGSLLQDVIAEPYLSKVHRDVASARKAGWFWSYRLSDLYVENVEHLEEEADGQAIVTARLREKGDLFAITGKRADAHCYDNSYRAEYYMLRQDDNSWRISSVLVLGEE